ncbi:MAG: HAMP domain-containing sensor histidine kinase [Corynebacterium sp.]|nr:HAMP domain-containing sensor histidine kinase [Corynebacterium sp.]
MILRQPRSAEHSVKQTAPSAHSYGMQVGQTKADPESVRRLPVRRVNSLRYHVALLTAATVAIAIGLMLAATFWTVSQFILRSIDQNLESKVDVALEQVQEVNFMEDAEAYVQDFKTYNSNLRISVSPPGWGYYVGDDIPLTTQPDQSEDFDSYSIDAERIATKSNDQGAVVIIAQDLDDTYDILAQLGIWLVVFGSLGLLIALLAGWIAARTSLHQLEKLNANIREIAENDDLREVSVVGKDEIAALARSFNALVVALKDSRQRQAELVMDAGHELKTPLTSLRNNIELLMMVSQSPQHSLPPGEIDAMYRDIIAQLDELSTLIGDLVDLAREDGSEVNPEAVDLEQVVETAVTRVRRRGASLEFKIQTAPWHIVGDSHALERCVVNLLDNAAKWSPANGVVRLSMTPHPDRQMLQLEVSDSGPGIPIEDREKVFNRFYRSVKTRSTPGSGLGLSIVQSTVTRHGGDIFVADSDDGGCRMVVYLPGSQDEHQIE